MLSDIPKKLKELDQKTLELEILRAGIIAELDAINLYEQMAAMTENGHIRKVLLDIAREEKAHFGEFEALLMKLDPEQVKESAEGRREIEELTGD
ncbi:MAG: rubrerythrin [candidate division WOR-3 bacterium]|uniref:Rubrerythrin n=1 Tax=candidate division WOR-3 bacterium TaxID=2052148 RepID=A0A7C3IX76_UNCW3|nr:rubrerythrin [candidate division WOR-3 bacterium]